MTQVHFNTSLKGRLDNIVSFQNLFTLFGQETVVIRYDLSHAVGPFLRLFMDGAARKRQRSVRMSFSSRSQSILCVVSIHRPRYW